jgi:plastocyanin/copper chaperone CopZ
MKRVQVALLMLLPARPAGAELLELRQSVAGLDCAACEASLGAALQGVAGVESATASAKDGVVEIKLKPDNRVSVESLRELIRSSGFRPTTAAATLQGTIVERSGGPALDVAGLAQVWLLTEAPEIKGRGMLAELQKLVGRSVTLKVLLAAPGKLDAEMPRTAALRELAPREAAPVAATDHTTGVPAPAPRPTGTVAGTVRKKGGAPKADVVVYLVSNDPVRPSRHHPEMNQRDLSFAPGFLVVTKGTTVDFPNQDKVFHNVFSLSQAAKFDLGLYKSGTRKSITVREAGVIDVYCNIHPDMVAKIKVVDSPYYAVTGKDGSFQIKGVPPGIYPIVAWQPYGEPFRGTVTVTSNGIAKVAVELVEGSASTQHLRKDLTPYGRYQ